MTMGWCRARQKEVVCVAPVFSDNRESLLFASSAFGLRTSDATTTMVSVAVRRSVP